MTPSRTALVVRGTESRSQSPRGVCRPTTPPVARSANAAHGQHRDGTVCLFVFCVRKRNATPTLPLEGGGWLASSALVLPTAHRTHHVYRVHDVSLVLGQLRARARPAVTEGASFFRVAWEGTQPTWWAVKRKSGGAVGGSVAGPRAPACLALLACPGPASRPAPPTRRRPPAEAASSLRFSPFWDSTPPSKAWGGRGVDRPVLDRCVCWSSSWPLGGATHILTGRG
jgi:hypothetical protein